MQNDLSERFLEFAASILKLGEKLCKTSTGRHVSGQLTRAGTSAGANYEEACSAESQKDFVHKLQIVLKELKESFYWLRLINQAALLPTPDPILIFLLKENKELINIIAKSIVTAKQNQKL